MDANNRGGGKEEVVSPPASSPSPTSSGDDDRDHFGGLMDENGVIGLLEALELVGVGDYSDECAPVEAETQLGEVGYNRSRSPSPRESPGEDGETLVSNSTPERAGETKNDEVKRRSPWEGNKSKHSATTGTLRGTELAEPGVVPEEALTGADGASPNGSRNSDRSWQPPTPSARTTQPCPVSAPSRTSPCKNASSIDDGESRSPTTSEAAKLNKSRKSHLNSSVLDYSKVKPRINLPKIIYKPPKSRLCSKSESPSPGSPTGCKSFPESVKVALPATPDSPGECQELGSSREDTRLLCELEENYNKLWIKYAEAENTIDHLRLAAKVNLYSDGPKPGHSVQSVYNQEASKFMMLNFPQAQRAEASSVSLQSHEHRTPQNPPGSPVTKEPSVIIQNQASDFLQMLQTFEDLLKCKELDPDEQRKKLSQLFESLRSLESSYLVAKDEHKLLHKGEEENSLFDPDRKLEGLIFDCVLYMDELKEQLHEELLTRHPSPSPARSLSPSEGREKLTHLQKTPEPSLEDPHEGTAATSHSTSHESDGEEAQRETASSASVNVKHEHSRDFITLPDDYQTFKAIPKLLVFSRENKSLLQTPPKTDPQPGEVEQDGPNQEVGNLKIKLNPGQRNLSPEGCTHSSTQLTNQPSVLDPSSRRAGCEMRTSHSSSLSSLGGTVALEKSNSKQSGSCMLPSQDGIASPETDSGFNGTESRQPTPTGAPALSHQGPAESVFVVQDRKPKKPYNGVVTSPHTFLLLPSCCPVTELSTKSNFNSKKPKRTKPKKGRREIFTCSHQSCINKSESGMSDAELSSSSMSEDGLTSRYTESLSSLSPSSSCSSQRCHGSRTKVRPSLEATTNSVSMQTLQAEVSRLHQKLERCLRERERSVSLGEITVEGKRRHPRTSTPHARTGSRDVTAGRRRLCCGRKKRYHCDISGSSDRPQTQSVVSRCTQTLSAAADNYANTGHSKSNPPESTTIINRRSASVQAPEPSDEPDTTDLHPALHRTCLRCIPHQQQAQTEEPMHSCLSHHCHHCGCAHTVCHRLTHATTNTCQRPAEAVKCCAAAAPPPPPPPPPLQYLCPLPVLLYSSPSNNDAATGAKSREEANSQRKGPRSPDGQNFLDRSLDKAIRAAKNMRTTSGHMSHSLRFGLHQQQQLLTPLVTQLSQRHMSNSSPW